MSFDRNQFDLFTFLLGKISGAFDDVTVAETENMYRSCSVYEVVGLQRFVATLPCPIN